MRQFLTYYLCFIAYCCLAAISPQATVVPNTWPELARIAVLFVLASLCVWWGTVTSPGIILARITRSGELPPVSNN